MMGPVSKFLKLDVLLRPFMSIRGWYFRLSPWMMTCREFNHSIYESVEGDLSGKQLTLFERHKQACPICRNFLKTYTATHQAKSHIFPYENIDVADEVPQDLIDAILDVKRNQETKNIATGQSDY